MISHNPHKNVTLDACKTLTIKHLQYVEDKEIPFLCSLNTSENTEEQNIYYNIFF